LQANNTKYDDDGRENIIDDYCALMAASELWMATNKPLYRDEARQRAKNLAGRMTPEGYFIANDSNRPFWHASDAGLPVIALARYLDKENDPQLRGTALATIKKALDYNLRVTSEAANPFGYARQTFLFRGQVRDGFFIPHENESGWWWQGGKCAPGLAGLGRHCGWAPGLSGAGRLRNQNGSGQFCQRPDGVDPG
jgi:ligand-binding sensor domain-containing protein